MAAQRELLDLRYDLSDSPSPSQKMSRGKPVQAGVRVKLPENLTWDGLAEMTSQQIHENDVFPAGFFPLPHPNHPEGGMLFPHFHIDPAKATAQELAGQELFFGKAKCSTCHPAPVYTDGLMHDLKVERFYEPRMINGMMASVDGPIKTFVLRGIKESSPYLHDGRLLTLDDTVEFFNLVLELKPSAEEKAQLLAFLYTL
jgi:cytochrome c peroxidase